MLTPYAAQTPSQPSSAFHQNENEYHKQIDDLTNLARVSEKPEFFYQTIALAHFKHNRPEKALKAVLLAEENARENSTAPLSTYLAIFQRAKYYSSSNNLAYLGQARNDLLQISKMEEISHVKRIEINLLLNQIAEKLLDYKNNIIESNKKQGIPCEKGLTPLLSLYTGNLKNYLDDTYRTKAKDSKVKICPEAQKRWSDSSYQECMEILKTYRSLLECAKEKCIEAELLKEADCPIEEVDNLYREAEILIDQATEAANYDILKKSAPIKGKIQAHFKNYMLAFEYFEDAIIHDPSNNDLKVRKADIELELMKLGPRERLAWIDPLLISSPNSQHLLLFKAEAHFLLDEEIEGAVTANKLLKNLRRSDGIYELVFRMANAVSFF